MNGKLQKLKWVEKTFVQPAANDSGVCIGAAYLGAVKSGEKKIYPFDSAYLGFNITDKEIENFVKTNNLNGKYIKDIEKYTAEILSKGNIVAWMQSKLEFGPRALGHRSLLGDPRSLIVKDKLNNIKQRESWRPVAPSIVETKKKYHSEGLGSKYMTHAINMNTLAQKEIPGAIHVDGTARIQIVDNENDPYYKLIKQFENITGVPAILNTSLNKKGDPLCCTIEDGIDFFYTTQTDYLIINNWCFSKK
jgi:carbamoyltransferase